MVVLGNLQALALLVARLHEAACPGGLKEQVKALGVWQRCCLPAAAWSMSLSIC